jgi:hypothetical protein
LHEKYSEVFVYQLIKKYIYIHVVQHFDFALKISNLRCNKDEDVTDLTTFPTMEKINQHRK